MVRSLVADENLLSTLLSFSQPEAFVPGLILGQSSEQKDYVVHFAATPLPDGGSEGDIIGVNFPAKVAEIQEKWLAAHATNLTRMLPGGMWVLGLFVVGTGDVFSDKIALVKIRSLVTHIHNACKNNPHMYGKNPNYSLCVLHVCPVSKNYVCKSFEVENLNSSVKQVTVKFNAKPVQWFQIDCSYNLSRLSPMYFTKEKSSEPLKRKLLDLLESLTKSVDSAVCALNGKFLDNSESLESVRAKTEEECKKKEKENESAEKEENNDIFKAKLYIPQEARNENDDMKVEIVNTAFELECSGRLSSRVYMHYKATVEEATKAIKEDIIRSWAARLEMHWNSYDESADKNKIELKVLHFPPRRVLCQLPNSSISFSEYIFPDEGIPDVIASLEEQLGIDISENAIDDTFERQYDPNKPQPGNQDSNSDSTTRQRSKRGSNSLVLVVGIIIAIIVLILSIVIQMNSTGSS